MAYRHFVSLYLLPHLSELRFVIISIDTIPAFAAITHQILFKCSTNSFECSPELSLLSELNKGFDRCAVHIFYFAFGKQIAMNDARVIGRQLPPLSPKITDILGTPLE